MLHVMEYFRSDQGRALKEVVYIDSSTAGGRAVGFVVALNGVFFDPCLGCNDIVGTAHLLAGC